MMLYRYITTAANTAVGIAVGWCIGDCTWSSLDLQRERHVLRSRIAAAGVHRRLSSSNSSNGGRDGDDVEDNGSFDMYNSTLLSLGLMYVAQPSKQYTILKEYVSTYEAFTNDVYRHRILAWNALPIFLGLLQEDSGHGYDGCSSKKKKNKMLRSDVRELMLHTLGSLTYQCNRKMLFHVWEYLDDDALVSLACMRRIDTRLLGSHHVHKLYNWYNANRTQTNISTDSLITMVAGRDPHLKGHQHEKDEDEDEEKVADADVVCDEASTSTSTVTTATTTALLEQRNFRHMRDLLMLLQLPESNNPGLAHMVTIATQHLVGGISSLEHGSKFMSGEESLGVVASFSNAQSKVLELFSLKALSMLVSQPENRRPFVQHAGLRLLENVLVSNENNEEIHVEVARILANLASYDDDVVRSIIVRNGWLLRLHEWVWCHRDETATTTNATVSKDGEVTNKIKKHSERPPSQLLSGHAVRALANLDRRRADSSRNGTVNRGYLDGVFLLHPQELPHQELDADIIFVHGFLGGAFFTWRASTTPLDSKDTPENVKGMKTEAYEISQRTSAVANALAERILSSLENIPVVPAVDNIGDVEPIIFTDHSFIAAATKLRSNYINMSPLSSRITKGKHHEENGPAPDESRDCWPRDWLAADVPRTRILSVDYRTLLSEWASVYPDREAEMQRRSLRQRSSEMLDKLHACGVGSRPIIWVCHSMGGLLVKRMLVDACKEDGRYLNMAEQTLGVVFYSTPHRGSPLAEASASINFLINPSIEVHELRMHAHSLETLDLNFSHHVREYGWSVLGFGEQHSTRIVGQALRIHVVPEWSSWVQEHGGEYIMLESGHLNICKPYNRLDFRYQRLLAFVNEQMKSIS